jgi:guanylate kinase
MTHRQGTTFVVAAPSGVGKTTVCRALVESDAGIVFSVSHTTRPQRSGERDGYDYHFVDRPTFRRLVDEGAFVEHAEYSQNLYGTSWAALREPLASGRDVLLEIEVQGAAQVRERVESARLVFLLPPSLEELERRLRDRGTDADAEVRRRLAIARREIQEVDAFDYAIVNDRVERAVAELRLVVERERAGEREPLEACFAPERLAPGLRLGLGLPPSAAAPLQGAAQRVLD